MFFPGTYTLNIEGCNNTSQVTLDGYSISIALEASSTNICQEDIVTLSTAVNPEGSYTYSWTHNGEPILGVTESTYVINNAQESDAGKYQVTAVNTENNCSSISNAVNINVKNCTPIPPTPPVIAKNLLAQTIYNKYCSE